MSKHLATVSWDRAGARFTDNRYSRVHQWEFDGGAVIQAAASPDVVPLPLTDGAAVDPEEAFVAAVSSCHMLWFLSLAAKEGFCVNSYRDQAVGTMGKNEEGRDAVISVALRPHAEFGEGKTPTAGDLERLHEAAHDKCFIANSIRSTITREATFETLNAER